MFTSQEDKISILESLKDTYYELCDLRKTNTVLINIIVQKAGFKNEDKEAIFKLFGVKKYADIVAMIPGAKIIISDTKDKKLIITEIKEEYNGKSDIFPTYKKKESSLSILERMHEICKYLNKGLFGKDEAVGLALLSAIAGESIFFLGLPGTAKSMISRRITCAFRDIDQEKDYFEYLMNEFSTPDEICGPVSLAKLNQDEYVRKTEGYPSVSI